MSKEIIKKDDTVTIIEKPKDITLMNDRFCHYYTSCEEFFGDGTNSYLMAYNLDPNNPKDVANARSSASRLLVDPRILNRIDIYLTEDGFNNGFIDKQLLLVAKQNADFSSKMAAIREYNKLKQRIVDKAQNETEINIKVAKYVS